jgi:hypothetical protein
MLPHEDVQIYPQRASESLEITKTPAVMDGTTVVTPAVLAPGYHFNLRVFGKLGEQLRNEQAVEGEKNWWNKVKLKNYIDTKLGTAGALADKEVSGAKLPGGYEWTVGGAKVRLYDAAAVTGPRGNVWA